MPVNPHVKGGTDVPVTDGGTGASAGSGALTNLGGLSTASHAVLSHTGIPGVGDLTTAAHVALDHSAIPGAGGGRPVTTSTTIPANSLSADGQMLLLFLRGTQSSTWSGNLQINGVTISSPVSFAGMVWSGVFLITRTAVATAVVIGSLIDENSSPKVAAGVGTVASGLNWSGAQTITVTGTGSPTVSHVAAVVMK
jgi:hypothetical protein